jgi:hypothetical protein
LLGTGGQRKSGGKGTREEELSRDSGEAASGGGGAERERTRGLNDFSTEDLERELLRRKEEEEKRGL